MKKWRRFGVAAMHIGVSGIASVFFLKSKAHSISSSMVLRNCHQLPSIREEGQYYVTTWLGEAEVEEHIARESMPMSFVRKQEVLRLLSREKAIGL